MSPISRRKFLKSSVVVATSLSLATTLSGFTLDNEKKAKKTEKKRRGPAQPAPAPVPYRDIDIILGEPSNESIVFSLLRYDKSGQIELLYGPKNSEYQHHFITPIIDKNKPLELKIDKLLTNTEYFYQLRDSGSKKLLAQGDFHTQRAAATPFTFTITADSHLDNNTDPALYLQTLANIGSDKPDFHIDLGDTFMTGKHANRDNARKQYLAQRFYFNHLHAPLYLVIGNHDGEEAKQRRGGADSLAVWASKMRTDYFPNPKPDNFYSGNNHIEQHIGLLEDYYAWHWGDALFVVLNPYWQASANNKSGRWSLSLGKAQYQWLKNTLASSKAKYKLVFIHQLVGGLENHGRGGVEAVPFAEWGGKNGDGSDGFKTHRGGWDMPIHALLVNYGVNAVFHGHDHLFAYQQLDGIVYQALPQPAHRGFSYPRSAKEYGYTTGTILGGSGHMRFKVAEKQITAEYIQTDIPRNGHADNNGKILHRYTIAAST